MRKVVIVVILAALAGVLVWRTVDALRARQAQGVAAPRPAAAIVQTARVRLETLTVSVTYVGDVSARSAVDVVPRVGGQIVSLPVSEGDGVRAGQVVAQLDVRDLRFQVEQAHSAYQGARVAVDSARAALNTQRARLAQVGSGIPAEQIRQAELTLRQARASLEFSRGQLRRMEDLFAQGYVSQQRVDEARLDVALQEARVAAAEEQLALLRREPRPESTRIAQAQVEEAAVALRQAESRLAQAGVALRQAQSQLSETTITAPVSGVVGARLVEIGQQVTPGIVLMRIVDIDTVFVTVPVTERDLARVRPGQSVTVRAEAVPGRTFTGRIAAISPLVETATRTADAKIAIINTGHLLRPGMVAGAEVILARRSNVLVVPIDAVVQRGDRAVVFVIADGTARERPVQTGASSGGVVEILQGLRSGEIIAVSGHRALRDGAAVVVPERTRRP
ncbi:MAG: efflux RND transporter periplasmic adaptor subunit [bacterium]